MPKGCQLKVNGKFDKRFFTSSFFFAAAMKIMKIVQTGGVSHEEGGWEKGRKGDAG